MMMMMRMMGGWIAASIAISVPHSPVSQSWRVALAHYAIVRTPRATPFGNILIWNTSLTLVFHPRPFCLLTNGVSVLNVASPILPIGKSVDGLKALVALDVVV